MDIHVYLNGRLLKTTQAPREWVLLSMRERLGASLHREWVIQTPRQPRPYLKMRFVSAKALSKVEAQHLTQAPEAETSTVAQRSAEA